LRGDFAVIESAVRQDVFFEGMNGIRLAGDRWDPASLADVPMGTVLLLHGGGQTRHSYRTTAQRLATHGWTAIAIDARGHGDSQWAPDGDYSLDAFVADLYSIVGTLDDRPVLMGASLGGMTALIAQGERNDLAAALILADITPRVQPEGRARIFAFMTSVPEGFATLENVADAIQAYNPHRTRPRSLEGLKKNVRQGADGRWYWHWDPRFLDLRDEPSRAVVEPRLYQAASQITVPTLLVRGTYSDIVTPEAAEEFLELVPTASMVDVPAGHMVAGDDNDVFTEQVLDFLATNLSKAAGNADELMGSDPAI
jgi:pimeloyl-ACP methyl ester carboxylesterase